MVCLSLHHYTNTIERQQDYLILSKLPLFIAMQTSYKSYMKRLVYAITG